MTASLDPTVKRPTIEAISKTTPGFAIPEEDHGILLPHIPRPAANLEDIDERYARSRATASPTESEHKDYVNKVEMAPNEATMVHMVNKELLKDYKPGYSQVFNQECAGFTKDADFNKGISCPQPDFVEGLEMQQYDPLPVNELVPGAVLYKDNPYSLTLPHPAGKWKGLEKDMLSASQQSAYDGAALTYARNRILTRLEKPDPLGYSGVTTLTTDGSLEYHKSPIKSTSLVDSHQEPKDGLRWLRNEQDHAFKQSCALRDQLKEHWELDSLRPVAKDIDEASYEADEQLCQPTPSRRESRLEDRERYYSRMKVKELQKLLKKIGRPTCGVKKTLAARILEYEREHGIKLVA